MEVCIVTSSFQGLNICGILMELLREALHIAGALYPHKIQHGKIDAFIPPPLKGYMERNPKKKSQGEKRPQV